MNKNQAFENLKKQTDPKSIEFEHTKALLLVRCVAAIEHPLENLRDIISEHIESTKSLSARICCLNTILTIATTIGTIIGGITLLCKLFGKF